jgi:hypothetical protein
MSKEVIEYTANDEKFRQALRVSAEELATKLLASRKFRKLLHQSSIGRIVVERPVTASGRKLLEGLRLRVA